MLNVVMGRVIRYCKWVEGVAFFTMGETINHWVWKTFLSNNRSIPTSKKKKV